MTTLQSPPAPPTAIRPRVVARTGLYAVLAANVAVVTYFFTQARFASNTLIVLGRLAGLYGALLMAFTLALYSTGEISLLFVLAMFVAHFIPTFLYVIIAPFFVPELVAASRAKKDPFGTDEPKSKAAKRNPFKGVGKDED